MSARVLLVVIAAIVAVVAPSAPGAPSASTLYVDRLSPQCSDAAGGAVERPFCSIGAAAARTVPGQTVRVAAGTYREMVVVPRSGTRRAPISFAAVRRAKVVVRGGENGFRIRNVSWVSITGFRVTDTESYGIATVDSSHVTLASNRVSRAGYSSPISSVSGIYLRNVTSSLVSGNTANNNSFAGITLTGGASRNVVSGNLTYANARGFERAAPGIRLYGSPENVVTGNISYHNEDSGIEVYAGSHNTLVSNNVAFGNGDHGIDSYKSIGTRVVGNTVHRNTTSGINVEGGSTGAQIANNISVDNGIASPRSSGNIRVDASSTSETAMNFNQVFGAYPDALVVWDSKKYRSLAILTAATGQEASGINADPLWKDPQSGDYHLTSASPGVDSADSGAPGHPAADLEGCQRVDVPARLNSGAGPRAYEDRGAFELQLDEAGREQRAVTIGNAAPPFADPACRYVRTS